MQAPQLNDIIIAQCTPQGTGAVALLRLCGPAASGSVRTMVASCSHTPRTTQQPDDLRTCSSHRIIYGWVRDEHERPLDQVLFLVMDGPHTFTGDDTVEITCHNNPFIIQSIIDRFIRAGARMARPGEFTQRAVTNGKLDMLQAEAVHDLIHAHTQQAINRSLQQLRGSLSSWVATIEKIVLQAAAWCQASFEFLDDEGDFAPQISSFIAQARADIAQAQASYEQQKLLRAGFRIALIGSVNAGKSSIFNLLIQEDRAIVADVAGTTRDTIEAGLYRNGAYWTLIDTAGLRETHDTIEREGIRRSYDEATKADVILLVYDRSRALTPVEAVVYNDLRTKFAHKILIVYNKADLPSALTNDDPTGFHVSGAHKQGRLALEQAIQQKIDALVAEADTPFLLNKRHMQSLSVVDEQLAHVETLLRSPNVPYELISYHLHDALEALSGMTGKSVSEQSMDLIFREFCVGK